MKKRVGILTSGGDCPGLNATIRGVAKALYARMGDNVEIVGILNGYSGLINGDYKEMSEDDFRGILTLGGTILGTKRTPFKMMRVVEDDNVDKVAAMKKDLQGRQAGLPALPGRQWHPQNGQPALAGRAQHHRPAQDHRQRHLWHRCDLWLPHCCGHCHGGHRPHPHHRRQPQPRDVH